MSVLTDQRFFGGSLEDLGQVSSLPHKPAVLRKDFNLSPYQILEARAGGAAAVLLIAACLTEGELRDLYALTCQIRLDALIEVNTRAKLKRALACEPAVVGVNNRDLTTFEVCLVTGLVLIKDISSSMLRVAERGCVLRRMRADLPMPDLMVY